MNPSLPSKIISIVGFAPSCAWAAGGRLNVMFIQPDFDRPSNRPRPANDIVPMFATVIDAVNSTRAEGESAVLSAALATGSKANVSPPQPTKAVVQSARQSRQRTRRTDTRLRDRPRFRSLPSLE